MSTPRPAPRPSTNPPHVTRQSCRASYTGSESEHCCWIVGLDNDPYGLTARDVYLIALRHIDACTFVPELHVAPSRPPFELPLFVDERARMAAAAAPFRREMLERAERRRRIRMVRLAEKAAEEACAERARLHYGGRTAAEYAGWSLD